MFNLTNSDFYTLKPLHANTQSWSPDEVTMPTDSQSFEQQVAGGFTMTRPTVADVPRTAIYKGHSSFGLVGPRVVQGIQSHEGG